MSHRDMADAVGNMKKALDAAPESKMAPMLKQMIAQLDKSKKSAKKDEE